MRAIDADDPAGDIEHAVPAQRVDHRRAGRARRRAGPNPPLAADGIITTGRLRFENPAYSTYDAAAGIAKDAWAVSLVGENLANSNASLFTSTQQFIVAQTPLRPRVLSVNVSYKF